MQLNSFLDHVKSNTFRRNRFCKGSSSNFCCFPSYVTEERFNKNFCSFPYLAGCPDIFFHFFLFGV